MDIKTLMAARLYVRDTANALGAVKGSPCTITSITEADDGIHIVFSWTGTDGTVATQTAIMPYVAVDKVAREAVETLRDDMDAAIDTTVRSINGRKPDSAGNVALPLSVTGVPNTGSPHQVYVTDGEGVPRWEDRTHWEETQLSVLTEVSLAETSSISMGTKFYAMDVSWMENTGAENANYVLEIDGIEHEASKEVDATGLNRLFASNVTLSNGTNIGQVDIRRLIGRLSVNGAYSIDISTYTVKVHQKGTTVHTLDPKYLPEDHINGLIDTKLEGAGGGGKFPAIAYTTGDTYYNMRYLDDSKGLDEQGLYDALEDGRPGFVYCNISDNETGVAVCTGLHPTYTNAYRFVMVTNVPNNTQHALRYVVYYLKSGEKLMLDTTKSKQIVTSIPMASKVADAAGDTPTAAEFNALLQALKDAGLMYK